MEEHELKIITGDLPRYISVQSLEFHYQTDSGQFRASIPVIVVRLHYQFDAMRNAHCSAA